VANGYDPSDLWRQDLEQLRLDLGLPVEPEPGLFNRGPFQWAKGLLGLEANVGGQLLGLLAPDAYQRAEERLRTELQITPESSLARKAEALPGLGFVGAELIPESIRESTLGKIAGPVGIMIGEAAGSPSTYALAGLPAIGRMAARGIPALSKIAQTGGAQALRGALQAEKIAPEIKAAIQQASAARRAGVWLGQHAMPIPELVQGIGQTAAETWRLAMEQKYGEAATVGASGALLAGLAGLIGKGVYNSVQASKMMDDIVRKNEPALAAAADAAEEGRIPTTTQDVAADAEAILAGEIPVDPTTAPTMPPTRGPEGQGILPGMEGMAPRMLPSPEGTAPFVGPIDLRGQGTLPMTFPGQIPEPTGITGPAAAPRMVAPDDSVLSMDRTPRLVTPEGRVEAEAPAAPPPEGPPPAAPPTPPTPAAPRAEPDDVRGLIQEKKRLENEIEALLDTPARQARQHPGGIEGFNAEIDARRARLAEIGEPKAEAPAQDVRDITAGEGPSHLSVGERARPEDVSPLAEREAEPVRLTSVESEVYQLRREGLSHEQIAEGLGLTPEQVRSAEITGNAKMREGPTLRRPEPLQEAPVEKRVPFERAGKVEVKPAEGVREAEVMETKTTGPRARPIEVTTAGPEGVKVEVGETVVGRQYVSEPADTILRSNEPEVDAVVRAADEAAEEAAGPEAKALRTAVDEAQAEIAEHITKLAVSHGHKDPLLRLALKGLQDEVNRVRDLQRMRRRLADTPELRAELDKMKEDLALLKRDRSRYREIVRAAKKRALTDDEKKFRNTFEKASKRVDKAPFAKEVVEAGGVEKLDDVVKALEKGDMESLRNHLIERVNARMAMDTAIRDVDPAVIDSIGRIARKHTLEEGGTGYMQKAREGKAAAVMSAWQMVLKNKKFTLGKEKLTIKQVLDRFRKETDSEEAAVKKLDDFFDKVVRGLSKKKTVDILRKEKETQLALTKEGEEFDIKAEVEEPEIDPYQVLAEQKGKENIEAVVADLEVRDPALRYKDRWVTKEDLQKYIDGVKEGLEGPALGRFIWGEGYPRNKLYAAKDVHDRLLGIKGEVGEKIHELEMAADSFFENFLKGKKLEDVKVDDEFTKAFTRLWKAWKAGDQANIWGKGVYDRAREGTAPAFSKLKEWAGITGKVGKKEVIEEVLTRFRETSAAAQTKLAGALDIKKKVAELKGDQAKKAKTETRERLGAMLEDNWAKPRTLKPGFEGPLAERFPDGKPYSAMTAPNDGRVYFAAEEGSKGSRVTLLGGRGPDSLHRFVREGRDRGLRTVEVPDSLAADFKPQIDELRRQGILKPATRTENAYSTYYQVDPGPPKTAANVTDRAVVAERVRATYDWLKRVANERNYTELLNALGGRKLGRGKGADDILRALSLRINQGRNLFDLDERIPHMVNGDDRATGPIRRLLTEAYLQGGERIFEDFEGVAAAMRQIRKKMGIEGELPPLFHDNGGYNGIFAIGRDRNGRALVLKINTVAQQKFLEDYVPSAREFLLEPLVVGQTKEGWSYRVERMGTPYAIRNEGMLFPVDLPAEVQASLVNSIEKIHRLVERDKVVIADVNGDWQWVAVDGKAYLVDRGVLRPADYTNAQGKRIKYHRDTWIAQNKALHSTYDQLTPAQQKARDATYREEVDNATGVAVNFDGTYDKSFQRRLNNATGREFVDGLDEVLQEMNEYLGLKTKMGGTTASPYLKGLYADGKVYTNPLEALYHSPDDLGRAAEDIVGTMLHEVLHKANPEHTKQFQGILDELKYLRVVDEKFDRWTKKVQSMLEERNSALQDLLPEFREAHVYAGSFGRESWRGEASLREAAPEFAEGRASSPKNRRVQGPEDLETGGGPGVQRGEPVPEGGLGEAGRVGEAPVDRGVDAREAAEGPEGLARGEEEGRRIAASEAQPGVQTLDEAHEIIKQLFREKRPLETGMNRALELARQLAWKLPEEEVTRLAKGTPAARSGVWARFNLDTIDGLSDRAKAAFTLWSELTSQNKELSAHFKKDTPRSWEQADKEAKKILGLRSKEDLYKMLGKKGNLSDTNTIVTKILIADLAHEVSERQGQFYLQQMKFAKGEATAESVGKAQTAMLVAQENFNNAAPKLFAPLTDLGRALAAAKRVARAQDPESAMWQDLRASLQERLRSRYKRQKDIDAKVDELMTVWAGVRSGRIDPEAWADAYRKAFQFSAFDKFLEAYKAFLLGWKSRAANITSNALLQGVREVERTVAIGLEKVYAKMQRRQAQRHWGEFRLNSMVLKHWSRVAIPEWATSFRDSLMLKPEQRSFNAAEVGTLAEDLMLGMGAIGGKTGEFVRFMFKGLNADDAVFKNMSRLQYYYREIYRRIRSGSEGWKKLEGEDDYQATARYVLDLEKQFLDAKLGKPTDKAKMEKYLPLHEEGTRVAREETFQKELPPTLKALQAALRDPRGKVFQMVFPFVRTPWNIAVETMRRTPAGFFEVAWKWADSTAPERMDLMARPLVGTAVGMWLVQEALEGNLTGGGPLDPVKEANLRETGWRAYAVKLGNQYFSYQRFEPLSSVVGMAADIAEGIKRGDFDAVNTGMTRMLALMSENLTNKTFLSGLEGLSTAMSDPQRYAGQWLKQMQMSLVPNSLGPIPFGHLAQGVDPVYRQTEPFSLEAFQAKVPWMSSNLPPQYTPTGELRKRPGTAIERVFWPVARSAERQDPTALAAKLLDQIGAPPTPPKKYTYIKGVRVWYTPEQRDYLAKAQAAATRMIGSRLVRDPNFMRLPDNEDVARLGQRTKKDVIKSLYDRYRRQAMARFQADLQRRARGHEEGEAR
jgi:DNA-binding CsgD family transcriptional regulator